MFILSSECVLSMYLSASKRICIGVENRASGTAYGLKRGVFVLIVRLYGICFMWKYNWFFFSSFSWSVLVLPITMAMKIRLNFYVLSRRNCITLLMAQPVNPVKKQRWVPRYWTKEMVLNWVGFTSHDRSTSVLDHYLIVSFSRLIMIPCPLYEGL